MFFLLHYPKVQISDSKLSLNLRGSGQSFLLCSLRHICSIRALTVWPRLGTGCWAALLSRATGTNLFSGAKRSLDQKEEAGALTWNLDFTFFSPPSCLGWELFPQQCGGMSQSFKSLNFLRQQDDLFDLRLSLFWHLAKKILVLITSHLVGNFKGEKKLCRKTSKSREFVWWCVYFKDKLCQKDRLVPPFVATAAAAQPQIAITHLHAKQEPIPSVANDARAADAVAKWLGK